MHFEVMCLPFMRERTGCFVQLGEVEFPLEESIGPGKEANNRDIFQLLSKSSFLG